MAKTRIRERIDRIGNDAFSVVQVWECPSADSQQHRYELWIQQPTVVGLTTSRAQPFAVSVEVKDDRGAEGLDWIIAKYRTLTNDEYMDRHPNRGILKGGQSLRGEKIRTTIDGAEVLQGADFIAAQSGRWQTWVIERGPHIRQVPQTRHTIRAIIKDSNYTTYIGQWLDSHAVGKVNSISMGSLNADKETLLFSRMAWEPHPYAPYKSKWIVEYDFITSGTEFSWKDILLSRAYETQVTREPIYLNGQPVSGETRDIVQLVPTSILRQRPVYATKNFGPLNGLLSWGPV